MIGLRGKPHTVVSDNGTELTSSAILRWSQKRRDECLNETMFTSLARARFVLDACRHDYNHVRPHSKLGGKPPAKIACQRVRGHVPGHVAIPSSNQHEGAGL